MNVKVVQVSTPPEQEDELVVIVPNDYRNCAFSLDKIAKALGRRKPAAWTILREQDVKTVEIS